MPGYGQHKEGEKALYNPEKVGCLGDLGKLDGNVSRTAKDLGVPNYCTGIYCRTIERPCCQWKVGNILLPCWCIRSNTVYIYILFK